MQLLNPHATFVQSPINRCSNCECSADDGAHAGQEPREGFGADFAIDDFHWGDILLFILATGHCLGEVVRMGECIRKRRKRPESRRGREWCLHAPCPRRPSANAYGWSQRTGASLL